MKRKQKRKRLYIKSAAFSHAKHFVHACLMQPIFAH